MKKSLLIILLSALAACSKSGSTINPVRKDIIETVYASGKIIPENEYHVYSLSNGTVKKKLVKEGDTVSAGGTLYEINSEAPAARLDAAQSAFANTQSNLSADSRVLNDIKLNMLSAQVKFQNDSLNYFRLKNLFDLNATSKSNLDNALTLYTISLNQKKSSEEKYYSTLNELNVAMHTARSQVAVAQSDLNNYFIRSEASGTIFQLTKEAGEAVHAGEVVALMGETSNRIIKLSVDQQDIDRIKTGQEVLLKADVSGNTIYHATISRIYPVMNEIDQTFRVDAIFKDRVQQSYVHSSVEANIIIQQKDKALIIPRTAMVAEDSVQVKQDGKTKNIFIETGIRTLDDVEVLKGLDESSQLIIPTQK